MNCSTVLVVEDEALIADDLQRTLRRLGYHVPSTAGTGAEAVELASQLKPSLVLMDIHLNGGMDGIEAAELVRSRHNVPVVFLTSYSDDATLQRAMKSQPYSYLLKPFNEGALRTAIEVALNRHRLESALAAKEEWFRTTLHAIADAVIAVDDAEVVTFVNHSAEHTLAAGRDSLVGKPLHEVFSLTDASGQPLDSALNQALASRQTVHPQAAARLKRLANLPSLDVDHCASPILDDSQALLGAVVVFRDITEAKALEEQVRRSERLASLGTLSAGIAHEINNPLSAITLNTDALDEALVNIAGHVEPLQRVAPVVNLSVRGELERAREALRDSRLGLQRVCRIINSVRRFTRAEAVERHAFSLQGLVDTGLELMRIVVTRHSRLEVLHQPAPLVFVDEGEFLQVLSNLLSNASFAVKNLPRGQACITVKTSRNAKGQAVLEVVDNGIGISPAVLARVFDPFFTTKPVGEGTGLGLSISHRIVAGFNGDLTLASNAPAAGTTARIVLPAHQPA